jgi:hypothetical protein
MAMNKIVNGVLIAMTDNEEAAFLAMQEEARAARPTTRTIAAVDFLQRFSATEILTLQTDAVLNAACLKVIAQGSVNLDSAELAQLLAYAVQSNRLAADRVAVILAG